MLNGRTALIVEGEFLIALDIQRMLEGLGSGQALFARSAEEAGLLESNWPEVALAVVELPHDNLATLALIDRLTAAGIPVVLVTTGTSPSASLPFPTVTKPVPEDFMASAVRTALAKNV